MLTLRYLKYAKIRKKGITMKKLPLITLALCSSTFLFAESLSFQEEVKVLSTKKEYRMITEKIPFQECYDVQVEVQRQPQNDNNGIVGGVIGGVAGGVLGHQVGGGSGKTAATVGGAIVGTLVGKNLAEQNSYAPPPSNHLERRCTTRYEERSTEQFMGYKNIATYKNQTIVKYSDYPLEYIRLNVTVGY